MARWLIGLGVIATLAAGAWFAWERYWFYLPGLAAQMRDPIAPSRPVVWRTGPASPLPADQRPPNIIVIVADDLGYNDLSWAGRGGVAGRTPTPNIDSLAVDGAAVEIAYAANATCSPSRAAIMTGRYPTRFGFEFTAVPPVFAENLARHLRAPNAPPVLYHGDRVNGLLPYPQMGVPASEVTIAEVLRDRGYHTIHLGKWHLGEAPELRPEAQGFAESLGFVAGGAMFAPANDPDVVNAKLPWDPIDRFLWANLPFAVQYNGGQRFKPSAYMTDYLSDQAVAAIGANRDRPFFMYLAYNAPHTPLQATRADYEAMAGVEDHTLRVYAAMIHALDRGVGKVLAALRQGGLDRNTLVIFTSDNGAAWYVGRDGLNDPFRGWKATFFEGGIRVPMFLRWPARIPAGARLRGPIQHMDIITTAAAAAGAPVPDGRDGLDALASLGATSPPPPRTLFWRSGHYRVVRAGDWKLQISERPKRVWLHDLAADPTERNDLSQARPDKVAELTALIEAHEREMPAPMWPALIEGPIRIDPPLDRPWREGEEYVFWAN